MNTPTSGSLRTHCSKLLACCSLGLLSLAPVHHAQANPVPDYQQGQQWLQQRLQQRLQQSDSGERARNLILFVGDGMSVTTLTAARILEGQQQGGSGEEHFLSFERFPSSALVKTYNTNQQTPDSAGTMTAIATGVKTRAGMLAVGPEQLRNRCQGSDAHRLTSLLDYASQQGYATGVVTTARLTHATPAATYAHTPERDWEADSDLTDEARQHGCKDIASQLIEGGFGRGLDIAMGGGRRNFLPTTDGGKRQDTDLTADFLQRYPQGQYLASRNDLLNMNTQAPVLGLFASSHMDYQYDRDDSQPSLTEMTFAALQLLRQQTAGQPQGFVLVIEGARIDHAHHAGNAYRALVDTIEMAHAVEFADRMTDDADTLIVVTADHSHTLSMAGYPDRGNDILGLVKNGELAARASDGFPYTTLGYANGQGSFPGDPAASPGAQRFNGRIPWHDDINCSHPNFYQASLGRRSSETHGSDDVALHAKGPGSQWFRGLLEQHSIFHLTSRALGLATRSPDNQPQESR